MVERASIFLWAAVYEEGTYHDSPPPCTAKGYALAGSADATAKVYNCFSLWSKLDADDHGLVHDCHAMKEALLKTPPEHLTAAHARLAGVSEVDLPTSRIESALAPERGGGLWPSQWLSALGRMTGFGGRGAATDETPFLCKPPRAPHPQPPRPQVKKSPTHGASILGNCE